MQTPDDQGELNPITAPEMPESETHDDKAQPVDEPQPVQAATSEVEEEDIPFTPSVGKTNFTQTKPVMKPIEGEEPPLRECVALMREAMTVLTQAFEHNDSLLKRLIENEQAVVKDAARHRDVLNDDEGNAYLRVVLGATSNAVQEESDCRAATLSRPESHWTQTIEHENKTIGPGIPVQRLANGKYNRDELLSYFTRKAGAGAPVDIPMWHSGIWLRFKAPTLMALTAMNQEIANIKVNIASETRGLAFSNVAHFIKNIVMDFALQHVVQANVSYTTPSDLKVLLDIRDTPAVYLGIASTLYPKGYPYAVPCIADPARCNHVVKELLQPTALWWVDRNSLTTWQQSHMAARINERSPKTAEDIQTYKKHHIRGGERLVRMGAMGFILACPSVFEHEDLGRTWLNGIIDMTQGAFNEPPGGSNRSAYISQLAAATSAREYAHWVKAIVELDDTTTDGYQVLSEDKEFIADALASVYSADEYLEDFVKEVEKYIDDSLLAMVAIPSFNCPACSSPVATKFKERFENLVVMDPLSEFFMLASRKLSRIL